MNALEHHRKPFGHGALQKRSHADKHVSRLVDEALDRPVYLKFCTDRVARFEAGKMNRRNDLGREECAHRLPKKIRRGEAGNSQPVGNFRCHRGFTRARRPSDQDDHGQIEIMQSLVTA